MKKRHFSKALSLILTLAMLLSISAVPMMASAASTPINPEIFIDEDFDGADVVPGSDLSSIDGWTHATAADTVGLDSFITIDTVDGSNALHYKKTGKEKANSATYTFDKSYSGGVFSARMKFKLDAGVSRFQVELSGKKADDTTDGGKIAFNIREGSKNDMFLVSTGSTNHYTEKNPIDADTWYEYELLYDTTNKQAALYDVDAGEYIWAFNEVVNMDFGNVVSGIKILHDRTSGIANSKTEANFYIDDILVRGYKKAEFDAERLSLPTISEDVKIELQRVSDSGSTITWSSSSDVINVETGNVTPGDDTENVTLTATVNDGTNTVVREFKFKIMGKNVLLYEDFDVPEATNGTDISEYNGWVVVENVSDKYFSDTTATIENIDGNGMLSIKRGTNGENSANYTMSKAFTESAIDGVLKTSFKVKCGNDEAKRFNFVLAGLTFDLTPGSGQLRVYNSDKSFDTGTVKTDSFSTTGNWNDIVVTINLGTDTLSLYINDEAVISDALLKGYSATESVFTFRTDRTKNGAEAQFYFDDIKVETVTFDLSVVGIEFKDAEGNVATDKVDGGSVSKVTVMANEETVSVAKIIAAVYDGNKLYSANIGTVSSAISPLAAQTVAVEVPLPETGAANATIRVFALDSMSNLKPVSAPFTYKRAAEDKITLWMCGDSMTKQYSSSDIEAKNINGLSNQIGNYFNSSVVEVKNLAEGGRSTKSFYDENRLQNELANIKHGDYVFIMFGHNDQKDGAENEYRHTEPYGSYQDYLTKFVRMARSRGAIPVLLTPITRRDFVYENENGETVNEFDYNSMGEYPKAMRDLAKELNVTIIDLTEYSQDWIVKLGSADSKDYYAKESDGSEDKTHMSPDGMKIMTEYVVKCIGDLNLPLSIHTVYAE